MMRFCQIVGGGLLCAYAVFLFAIDFPAKLHILGPFLLVGAGALLIVGPARVAEARKRRRIRTERYLDAHPETGRSRRRSALVTRLSRILYVAAVIWVVVEGWRNEGNLVVLFGVPVVFLGLGFALRLYGNANSIAHIFRAARESQSKEHRGER